MAVNPRTGKRYREQPAAGGVWHVYADGRRVFVKKPAQPAVAAAPGPIAPPAPPADPAGLVPVAQYAVDTAQSQFSGDEQRRQLAEQEGYDRADYGEALRRMATQRPRDEQATKEAANKQGLLFSGHLGRQLGDVATDYTRRQSDLQSGFDRRQAAREAARRALEGGATIDQAAALAALADRSVTSDTAAAEGGYLAPNPADPAVAAVTAPKQTVQKKKAITTTGFNRKRRQRFQTVRYGGKTYHVYKGGKPIPVRPR